MLISCLRNEIGGNVLAGRQRIPETDWRAIHALAVRQGVASVLYHAIREHAKKMEVPDDILEQMKRDYLVTAGRNLLLYRELEKLLVWFQAEAIPVVLLKGAHLAEWVYGNLALRQMADIDLLISETNLGRVEQMMLRKGAVADKHNVVVLQQNCHLGFRLAPYGLRVEIHWRLLMLPGQHEQDETTELWERARPIALGRGAGLILAPEDLLLHLCLHSAKHGNEMDLRMILDLAKVVHRYEAELDWQALTERARDWNVARAVYALLLIARKWLQAEIPDDKLETLRPDDFDDRCLAAIERLIMAADHDPHSMAVSKTVARIWAAHGLRAKFSLILQKMVISPGIASVRRQAEGGGCYRIYWWHYPIRIYRGFRVHGAILWHLLRGDKKARAAAVQLNETSELSDWLLSK